MWKRISSAIVASNLPRRATASMNLRRRASTSDLLGRGVKDRGDGARQLVPVRRLFSQPFPSGRRERVVLRLAVVLAVAPLGVDEPLLLETIEGGVERALRDVERAAGNLRDAQQ